MFGKKVLVFTFSIACLLCSFANAQIVEGTVFDDLNGNLIYDENERGIENVMVSNGLDVVLTDEDGNYSLDVDNETIIFITKPANFDLPLNEDNLPQFYYIHQPKGSPEFIDPGISPTGNLPDSVDFPLFEGDYKENFDIVVLADTQCRNDEELDYMRDEVISELVRTEEEFGVVLGDIVYDNLSIFPRHNDIMSEIGIPIFNVVGNHDTNYEAADNHYKNEAFKKYFGPPYYSFDYGKVHFIVLDTVVYRGGGSSNYFGGVHEKQLVWLSNDLEFVPEDHLIVLMSHIEWTNIRQKDFEGIFNALKDFEKVLTLAGHAHITWNEYVDSYNIDKGREKPIHLLVATTVCGRWWAGPKDVRGIPQTLQYDGVPNGYYKVNFDDTDYAISFKAAGMSEDYQMRISSPTGKITEDELENTKIVVNIFDGGEYSVVKCSVDQSPEFSLEQETITDPAVIEFGSPTSHIWTGRLPDDLDLGAHEITIWTEDQYGKEYKQSIIFEVLSKHENKSLKW